MEDRIQKLKKDINEILQWIEDDKEHPFTITNMGVQSKALMRKNHFVSTGKTVSVGGISADTGIEVLIDGDYIIVPVTKVL